MNKPKIKPTAQHIANLYGVTKDFKHQADTKQPVKRQQSTEESEWSIQNRCVMWFNKQYPKLKNLLCYNLTNSRNQSQGFFDSMIGMTPGRSDLVLYYNGKAYMIEMKKPGKKQSPNQIEWQQLIEKHGFQYVLIDNLTDFMEYVNGIIG
jgi:hypothetical protein